LFLCFFSLTFWRRSQIIIIFASSCYCSFQTWRWRHRAIIFVFFLYGLHHFCER
jgi:predicted ferric reductase